MKYASIAPPTVVERSGMWATGYAFALGQELIRDLRYLSFMQSHHRSGAFIMVDNGAAEYDTPPFSEIVRVANAVGADEIIMPDVLRDMKQTIDMTSSGSAVDLVEPRRRMIVPQGTNWDEWLYCLREIDRRLHGQFATIGVAKHLETLPNGRSVALNLLGRYGYLRRYNVHMLGIWARPIQEIRDALKWGEGQVRGIDSGAALAYAQNNSTINDAEHFSLDWSKDGPEVDLGLYSANKATLIRWCSEGANG